ncbi:MAG: polysaccharide deacetylase family protein [Micrococcales bacterium]
MDRRDFVKLASGLLVPAAMANSLPASAARSSVISKLPESKTKRIAWTVDDGISADSIKAYLAFAAGHYVKMTFFVTSGYPGWKTNEPRIRDLISKGLLQIANHTTHHKNLTEISAQQVKNELSNCHKYIEDAFGVDARPYYRPPFGAYNPTVLAAAADLGYTKAVIWSGSVVDTAAHPNSQRILRHAKQAMKDTRIVLSHANHMETPKAFPQIYDILRKRRLNLVRLDEVI